MNRTLLGAVLGGIPGAIIGHVLDKKEDNEKEQMNHFTKYPNNVRELKMMYSLVISAAHIDGDFNEKEKKLINDGLKRLSQTYYIDQKDIDEIKNMENHPESFSKLAERYKSIENKKDYRFDLLLKEMINADDYTKPEEEIFKFKWELIKNGISDIEIFSISEEDDNDSTIISYIKPEVVKKKYPNTNIGSGKYYFISDIDQKQLVSFKEMLDTDFAKDQDTEVLLVLMKLGAKRVYLSKKKKTDKAIDTSITNKESLHLSETIEADVGFSAIVQKINSINENKTIEIKMTGHKPSIVFNVDKYISKTKWFKTVPENKLFIDSYKGKNKLEFYCAISEYSSTKNALIKVGLAAKCNLIELAGASSETDISVKIETMENYYKFFQVEF